MPAAAAASALPQHHRSTGKGLELLLEHQLYLKSREALQKEDQVTVFDRSIYLFKCRLCRMVSVAAAGLDSSAARGAASPAPVSRDAYYRLVPRLSHLFPPPLKWEAMVIPLSQNT